ncbi:MAG: RNA methyltransferase [Alphaproteobacteria bacterium]|nr:RNA methyltransferase [Alphaproteobacteria bacterium]
MMQKMLTSLSNPTVKALRAMHEKKGRKGGQFLAEGLKIVLSAIENGWVPQKIVVSLAEEKNKHIKKLLHDLPYGVEVLWANASVMEKISARDNPQAVMGVFAQQFCGLEKVDIQKRVVVLENVRDPGNLGTIIRTADAAGVGAVMLVGETCDPFGLEAVRASMGSIFAVPLARVTLKEFIDWRKNLPAHVPVVGTHLKATQDYRRIKWGQGPQQGGVLVMGGEQHGMSDEISCTCTTLVKIMMHGTADSLNLAVATGILLFHASAAPDSES